MPVEPADRPDVDCSIRSGDPQENNLKILETANSRNDVKKCVPQNGTPAQNEV